MDGKVDAQNRSNQSQKARGCKPSGRRRVSRIINYGDTVLREVETDILPKKFTKRFQQKHPYVTLQILVI